MDWEREALERLGRVPFFIRGMVKKQVEEYSLDMGRKSVSSRDVTEARRALMGDTGQSDNNKSRKREGALTNKEIEFIEKVVEKGVEIDGLKTRFREIKACGGASGCPNALIDGRALSLELAGILDGSGLESYISGRVKGPALFHHKFRVAVSGCPNACSQPQIADFGVIGQSRPARGEGPCTECGGCVSTCREGAVIITGEGPEFDYGRCLSCGGCIRACPSGAIAEEWSGYRLLAGGKLGRHPRLAEVVLEAANKEQLVRVFERAIRLYMEKGRDGERFANMVERLGIERVREIITEGIGN
ncbi:MAG: 4Fe-4S dicluster domain-containing protein [Bacillota bacterium]